EEDAPKTKKRSKKSDDEEDRPKKRTAKRGDDDGGSVEADAGEPVDADTAISPAYRAIDVAVGVSFVARKLSFKYDSDLAAPPPGYRQSIPVAGAIIDATVFPLSFSHKSHDLLSGLGINVLYDQVIKINSQKSYTDQMGNRQTANIQTTEA